jgi:outer membrane biosynthesis protein TonB
MFTQLNPATARRQRWLRLASLALHAAVLAWLLHEPEPLLLNPVSVALGHNGNSVTRLYWPNKTPDASTHSSSDDATQRYRHQRFASQKLTLTPAQLAKLAALPKAVTPANDNSEAQTLSALAHGQQAGLPYGTLSNGQFFGDEFRPAISDKTTDPIVYPWQLPESAGNEVIEVTIDDHGNITRKIVLQSLGPDIDAKCLAALEGWHFQPATHNGRPIPSKYDTVFPFKARG